MRPIRARYGLVDNGQTAVIEMAEASGLPLLKNSERNPLRTSTYGTGQLIADALERGCRKLLIGIGGSATNDAGTGMLAALGYRFLDAEGNILPSCGESLEQIVTIDDTHALPELKSVEIYVVCDVNNPFCGPQGAAHIFAPQKGADDAMVKRLDKGMFHFAEVIRQFNQTDVITIPGAGAAGGLGGAFKAFLNARLSKGIDMVLDAIGFDQAIQNADLIITGEGKIDSQTSKGKVISGITERARKHGIPVIAIAGICDIDEEQARQLGLTAAFPTGPRPQNESDLKAAMQPETASRNISETIAKALVSLSPSLFHGNP
jgi:glycerate kinase